MWISSRYGPDDNIITQGFLDSIIGHGSAEREFKRHDISRPPARLDGLEAYGWLLGLPAPSSGFTVPLMDRDGHDITQQAPELDQQRLRCQSKDAQVPDLLTLDPPPHLSFELTAEVFSLETPIGFFVISVGTSKQFEVDRLPICRMAIGWHGGEDSPR